MARKTAPQQTKHTQNTDEKHLRAWSSLLLAIACGPLIMQIGMLVSFNMFPLKPFPASTGDPPLPGVDDVVRGIDAVSSAQAYAGDGEDCVISFSDIHGDLAQARAALSLAGVSNETHLWAAANCTFIQTGDLVDRGEHSIEVMQLFEDVKKAAEAAGGRFIGLLGNHEMINLQGDFRYIANTELTRIGDAALERHKLTDLLVAVPQAYRPGVLMYRGTRMFPGAAVWAKMVAAGGALGDAMRSKRIAAIAGSGKCRSLFVHAGMLPAMTKVTGGMYPEGALQRFNDDIMAIVRQCDGSQPCPPPSAPKDVAALLSVDGPLWTREVSEGSEAVICPKVAALLHAVGAERMVVGHTIQEKVRVRCGGQVLLMDVGMCTDIAGNLAALRCIDGKLSILQK